MFAMLNRLEEKIDALDGKVDNLSLHSATVTERLGNMANVTQAHLSADNLLHDVLNNRLTGLEHWRTGWKARMGLMGGTIALVIAIPVGIIVAVIKDMMGTTH